MLYRNYSRSFFGIALCTALVLMAGTSYVSAEDGQPVGRVASKIRPKGRLPKHYGEVVTEKQREDIYRIQGEYKPKIDALKVQLEALKKEMNDKISAVLTAEQKKKIEDAGGAAKGKSAKDEKPTDIAKPSDVAKPADSVKPTDTAKPAKKTEKNADK